MDRKKGFSLIELMVVMGILTVIVTSATSYGSRWFVQNNVESTKDMLTSSFQKAQSYAMSKKNGLTWGVCLSGDKIRLFGGSCASPTIKDDFTIPSGVVVSNFSSVTFSALRGEPDAVENVTISSGGKSVNVTMNLVGGINVN